MKTIQSTLAIALFAAGATLANAQYVSDGPFGPIAQVNTQRSNVEKQMASPTERAMNKADSATMTKADAKVEMKKASDDLRKDAFKQVDSAR